MKTFLVTLFKVALVLMVALLVYQLFPLLAVPLMAAVGVAMVIGGVMATGFAIVSVVALGLVLTFAVLALVVLGALSPLWIPILLVVGMIALIRTACRRPAP